MKYTGVITILVLAILYICIVGFMFTTNFSQIDITSNPNNGGSVSNGIEEKVSMNFEFHSQVIRDRWYGTIVEYGGEDNSRRGYLSLFNIDFIKIPCQWNSLNFLYIHFIFILLLVIVGLFFLIKNQGDEENIQLKGGISEDE